MVLEVNLIVILLTILVYGFLIFALCFYVRILNQKLSNIIHILNQIVVDDDESSVPGFNNEMADQLLARDKVQELISYCDEVYKELPKSVQVNWYYGVSYFRLGEYEKAQNYFNQVIDINPLWRDGADVYLQEIERHLSMTNLAKKIYH